MLCNRLSLTWSYLVLASLATIPTMVIRAVLISSVHKTNCISPQEVDILEYELLGLFISTLLCVTKYSPSSDQLNSRTPVSSYGLEQRPTCSKAK
ncbi:hypothetical protein BXZ70DRAFT_916812 [Cristinia sonorae]|uniref:Uncharacterized protein n=1 Tax=Cristinia sonorae TaxID=1940300 RepID=A0A8K0UXP9_9AGAR|nr:hypothetical protein BXZ70DRAFT_916812 [Cristinia sonorae]